MIIKVVFYLTTFLRTSTEISGIPQTNCSRCCAVTNDKSGTGKIQDIPSRIAATYTLEKQNDKRQSVTASKATHPGYWTCLHIVR